MSMRYSQVLYSIAVLVLAGCVTGQGRRDVYAPQNSAPAVPAIAPPPMSLPSTQGFPRSAEEVSGPAALSLLMQANTEIRAGRPVQAVAALERALRIEPRNPFVWQALANVRLQQKLPDQAENVALKSNSLAHGNPYIEVENWKVIAAARQARGDAGGASQAQQRAAELQQALSN